MKKTAGLLVAQLIAFAVAYPQSAASLHLPLGPGSSLHALSLTPSSDPLETLSTSSGISSDLPSVSPVNRNAILSATPAPASGSSAEGAFPKGSFGINIGLGLGVVYWGTGYGSSSGIAPNVILNYAITDKLGIGNIAVGLILSWASTKYNDGAGNTYKYSAFLIGARGEYHFILDNPEIGKKLDPYAGVMLGIVINSNPDVSGAAYALTGKSTGAVPGIFGGAHYYFNDNFGVFAELGYEALFVFNLGISFKLP